MSETRFWKSNRKVIEVESFDKKTERSGSKYSNTDCWWDPISCNLPVHLIYNMKRKRVSLFKNYFLEKIGGKIEKNQRIGKCQLFPVLKTKYQFTWEAELCRII